MEYYKQDLVHIVEKASTIPDRLAGGFVSVEEYQNEDLVDSRLKKWCRVVAQDDWRTFEKRLCWGEFNVNLLHCMLGNVRLADDCNLPTWVSLLSQALKATAFSTLAISEPNVLVDSHILDPQEPIPFQEVFVSFIDIAKTRLQAQAGLSYSLLSATAHGILERALLQSLAHLYGQSMILEFSIFRVQRQSAFSRLLEESLKEHSRDQYNAFIKHMLEGELLVFFREYPVLARLIATVTELWVDATAEFLLRLHSDWSDIQQLFQGDSKLGQVVEIQPSLSVPRNRGRSVSVITFASGLKLVYKPKDLGLEEAYWKLLDWLNQQEAPLPFKTLKSLNHSHYGWVEFVEHLPCKDELQAQQFYQRAGILLALLYALEATDCHYKNIIACGEHPVLIDTETLLVPQVRLEFLPKLGSLFPVNERLWNSVLKTGLLPHCEIEPEAQAYADISGLGNVEEKETTARTPKWENINTDNMSIGYEYAKTRPGANAPSLSGENLSPNDYCDEIINGFRKMYHFLVQHKEAILAPDGPFTGLARQRVRFVFRTTNLYASVLTRVLHPEYLRDGADRSIELDILSKPLLSADEKPPFWPLLSVEQQALEQMDIPFFTFYTDSDALPITSLATIDHCFTKPGYDLAIARLNRLDEEDMEQQIGLIWAALQSRSADLDRAFAPSKSLED
ncbi:MAG: type 2 lanthipeptide synthetase LanM [Nostoc sp.]|uniref:type 2 lanthipeptide synthetase LanM n=1 Tax=Nostoc sp. TaxID=1180 RepID=UPI002FF1AAFE